MNKNEIPTSIKSGSGEVEFGDIHNKFSSSKYGETLAHNIRWARYKPDTMSNQDWEKLLGADSNNLKHLELTYGTTRQFIRHNEESRHAMGEMFPKEALLDKEEQADLLLTALTHDWGESVVGDIPYDFKTTDGADEEFNIVKSIMDELYEDKDDKQLLDRMHYVADTIAKDQHTKLGKMFNAIEKIGYLRTALRAWQEFKAGKLDRATLIGLEGIIYSVLGNQIIKLTEYASVYPAVALYLKENRGLITEAFNGVNEKYYSTYHQEQEGEKKIRFKLSQEKWQEFYSTI